MANRFAMAGSQSRFKQPEARPAGFWAGYWHGLIAPIAFVASLFNPGVGLYETRNNGAWYNFGFILGIGATFGRGVKIRINKSGRDAKKVVA